MPSSHSLLTGSNVRRCRAQNNSLGLSIYQVEVLATRRPSFLEDLYISTPRGFEPLRAEPNGFRVHLLNRSDTVSVTTFSVGLNMLSI